MKRTNKDYDLIVIGSGAGAGAAAHYASSLGKEVAVVEREKIGGECPNYGCVPTKSLLHAARVFSNIQHAADFGIKATAVDVDWRKVSDWKDLAVSRTGAAHGEEIYHEADIAILRGTAHFASPHEIAIGDRRYNADKFLIATGSAVSVPRIPGLGLVGYLTYREVLELDELPKSMFIIGGGAIGCEFADILNTFGVKVTIAEASPTLMGREDPEIGQLLQALFEQRGIEVLTNSLVTQVSKRGDKKVVHVKTKSDEEAITVDTLLLATGKQPNIDNLNLERANVAFGKHGIRINDYMQTTNPNIYAAGDVVGPYLYTHTANYQSYIAGVNMFGKRRVKADYRVIPRCVFVQPEIAVVGLTEQEARDKRLQVKIGMGSIGVLGRANTSNSFDGFVKVITDGKGRIVGASVMAPRAGEIIHELALAMHLNATAEQVAGMIHAYPTFSEAVKIACASVK